MTTYEAREPWSLSPGRGREPEPIAVIGMACRFPRAPSPATFWRLLCAGGDAVEELPRERFDAAEFYDRDVLAPGKTNSIWGGFLERIDLFDPLFFSISPKEAVQIDPQQRLLLELSWEALEDAGIPPHSLRESRTGVYFGLMWLEYFTLLRLRGLSALTQHTLTGTFHSFAANRVSYALGLQGPSLAVDSASSASLVAVHLACESLRRGESQLALVGGASLMLLPDSLILMAKTGALSPDGRCRTFDARANGYVRGEGGGVVVLKPLAAARADRDPIYCVIRGSAINNDGASDGFSAPNPRAQEALLHDAYQGAGIAPCDVDYVEAHGTGTALGDRTEAGALSRVLGCDRPAERPLLVGSVKTNIGHLESAAGIAGFIKTALSLAHRVIPANLHFHSRNPQIPESLRIVSELTPWPAPDRGRPALAGVSSFGLGGTNAHVVLQEEWPRRAAFPIHADFGKAERPAAVLQSALTGDSGGGRPAPESAEPPYILTLSARSEGALSALARQYLDNFPSDTAVAWRDIAYSAGVRRSHHPHRLAVVAETVGKCAVALNAAIQGEAAAGLFVRSAPTASPPKVVFVFSGQGGQWLGMGRQLLAEEPVFRAAIHDCDSAIRREAGWSLVDELLADLQHSNLKRFDVMQPMVFSVATALAALFSSWGIRPAAVLGHSMGEVAAAYTAGALELADAVRIICGRSTLMQRMQGQGGVALIEASLPETRQLLTGYGDRLAVAGSNGPGATVISGEVGALNELLAELQEQGTAFRRVRVEVASHSAQMDPLRDELLLRLAGTRAGVPHTAMYSTVTTLAVTPGMLDADYWWRNLREPVLFWPTIERLRAQGYDTFLELSPHPILVPALQDGLSDAGSSGVALGTLRRDQPERRCLLESVGELYVRGQDVAWDKLHPGGQYVSLPTYPFQRERYWIADDPAPVAVTSDRRPPAPAARRFAESDGLAPGVFVTTWRKLDPLKPPIQTEAPGTWLVFTTREHSGSSIVAALRSRGLSCLQVEPGDRFAVLGQDRYQLNPQQPTDYVTLLQAADRQAGGCAGIVHLWSLDGQPAAQTTAESLDSEQFGSSLSAFCLAQALLRLGWRKLPPLWFVLRGTRAVMPGDAAAALSQSALWGLSQALALEYPELPCAAVDLEAATDAPEPEMLLNLILSSQRESLFALRGGTYYVPRTSRSVSADSLAPDSTSVRADGAYLIVGGLSDSGLVTAQWLAELGAGHLILADDREPRAAQASVLQRLHIAGRRVITNQSAAADPTALGALLSELRRLGPPLRGVILAAPERSEGLDRTLDAKDFQQALVSQLRAAWNLHHLTKEDPLDFCVYHGLAAPALSGSQLLSHLAAGAFMETLAQHRRYRGRPALAIRWGSLPSSVSPGPKDRGALRPGLSLITAQDGRDLFLRLLRGPHDCIEVLPQDIGPLFDAQPRLAASGLWAELLQKRSEPEVGIGSHSARLRDTILLAPPAERSARLETYLAQKLSLVLRLDPARIGRLTPFKQLGMDSMMSFELRRHLEAGIGVKLTSVVLYTYPNLAALAEYLYGVLHLAAEPPPPSKDASAEAMDIEQLSDDELISRLTKKLLPER